MSNAQPIRRKGITLGAARRVSAEELSGENARVIEENFPAHRTLHLVPNGGEPQIGERVEIVATEEVLLATAHHVAQDMSKESGGFLLGNRYECPNTNRQYIVVDQYMKADYTEGTQVSLTFTTDSWAQLTDRLEGKYRGKQLVGWYHSHPGMGIFLSNYDVDIHKNRFSNEWDVALVLDPVKHEGGFFAWVNGNINPREKVDFYELLESDSRETVVAWTNYTAEDPKTGAPAPLKAVNTQNSDGSPTAISRPPPAAPTAKGSSFNNPLLLIGGAAALVLLLLGGIVAGYFLLSPKTETSGENISETENQETDNKVLKSERIRINGKVLDGFVSSDNKMTVNFQILGIGEKEVIDTIRNGNLEVTINGSDATIPNTSVVNGSVLAAQAVIEMSPEAVEAFNSNQPQDFALAVDMFYNGDTVSRRLETKFQKGKGGNSLGEAISFNASEDKNVVPTKTKPKQVITEKQNIQTKPNSDSSKQASKPNSTTGAPSKPNTSTSTQNKPSTPPAPPEKVKGKGILDKAKDLVTGGNKENKNKGKGKKVQ